MYTVGTLQNLISISYLLKISPYQDIGNFLIPFTDAEYSIFIILP